MESQITSSSAQFNIKELVNSNLSINLHSKFVDKLKELFNNNELNIYIINLYGYLNFHPTKDFPINLENVLDFIGFANKGNAKRMLKNNFSEKEDYIFLNEEKKLLLSREKQVKERNLGGAGLNKEKIMLNIDCFKNLCMLVKTEKSKKIRKYYVKLETIYNELLIEESKDKENLLKIVYKKKKYRRMTQF